MDIKQLLEKMDQFAGEKVGQKPGDQFKGSDSAPPGKKLVGDSILKDLHKGKTPKTKEQELSEEFQAFLEAEFKDTAEKRPGRKSDRHPRGHEPQPRYKKVKTDEDVSGSQYKWEIRFRDGKRAVYYQSSPHYKDHTAASDIEYTLKSNKDAELISATKDGEEFKWQSLLDETVDNDPVEARWMVKVSDDKGDHINTYSGKYPNLSAAKKAYKKYEPYASDFKYKPVKKEQVKEILDQFSVSGFNPLRDERDYLDKLSYLSNLARQPGINKEMQDQITKRILDLNQEARTKGYIQAESRGHNIIATKLKNLERERKFASGELKIPTPQERQAQLKKLEKEPKQVKEYGATTTGSPTSTSTDNMKKAMAATSALKSATGTAQSVPALMKAMDAISQGKPASGTDMMTAQNTLQDINTAFKDPELANALKPILAKANQLQQKK